MVIMPNLVFKIDDIQSYNFVKKYFDSKHFYPHTKHELRK